MLELVLVCHGETEGDATSAALGSTDLPLTERGKRQARSLARVLSLAKPQAVYTSPLSRAADTAEIIARRHQMTVHTVQDLAERDYGVWENLPMAEIRTRFEGEYEAWQQDPATYEIPEGESAKNAYDRHVDAVRGLIKRHEEGQIVVVTHLGAIRNIAAELLGMGLAGVWRFQVNPGSICRLRLDENGYGVLASFNEF